jgi:molybdopterin-guanine dinucleotide biosynthesis protein A
LASGTAAFILAGGRSSRMGTDKAFLRLGGRTLLERSLELANRVCETVLLVGNQQRLRDYGPVVEDNFPGHGPLAGIHAALTSEASQEFNLILSIDIPVMSETFLKYLLKRASDSRAPVTVPRAGGHLQTLCAVYQPSFAAVAEEALRNKRNKIDPLFSRLPITIIEEEEMKAVGFSPDIFDNANTPEDWKRIQLRLGVSAK